MSALRAAPVHLDTARRLLQREPVVRVATAGPDGPHVAPMWFVWEPDGVYCSANGDDPTLDHVQRDSRVALVFDVGRVWPELAGVAIHGTGRPLRPGHPDLRAPMSRWFDKYRERFGRQGFRWFSETTTDLWFLWVTPIEIASWDHGAGPFASST